MTAPASHWHLTDGAVQAPRPRFTNDPTWAPRFEGRFTLTLCTSPIIEAPGRTWDGLCETVARRYGCWSPGIEERLAAIEAEAAKRRPA